MRLRIPAVMASVAMLLMASLQVQVGASADSAGAEQKILDSITGQEVYALDQQLEQIGLRHPAFRSAGTEGATEAATWLQGQLQSYGLTATRESYLFSTWDLTGNATLALDADGNASTMADRTPFPSFQCEHWSLPTGGGGLFAPAVFLPLPNATNPTIVLGTLLRREAWDSIDTTGKVVVVGREVRWSHSWEYLFVEKLQAQPPAAVVYVWNYEWMSWMDAPFLSSAGGRPNAGAHYFWDEGIPVGSLNFTESRALMEQVRLGGRALLVHIPATLGNTSHYNVVAEIPGVDEPERLVLVTAHYDTVLSPGFIDNGGGTAAVLELAKAFADAGRNESYKPRYTIRFVLFADEELGYVGSINYVRQHSAEMADVVGVLNIDCIGAGQLLATDTMPQGSFDLDAMVRGAASDLGVPNAQGSPGGSDQEVFLSPENANQMMISIWGVDPGIRQVVPVRESTLIASTPLLYSDYWQGGTAGWIHTEYDRSAAAPVPSWFSASNLGNDTRVVALALMRVVPNTVPGPGSVDVSGLVVILGSMIAAGAAAAFMARRKKKEE
jgi:hypothetical protein